MKIVVIGNYPPRKCGIATFTENFVNALYASENKHIDSRLQIEVIAMDDLDSSYNYPAIVTQRILQNRVEDYQKAINYINNSGFDYCHIQHEYGIFGGNSGAFVLRFLAQIKIPIGVTLHSVIKSPNYYQRQIIYAFGISACKIFVMNPLAIEILRKIYQVAENKIVVIEHGVPVFKPYNKNEAKADFGWNKNKVLMTFGLLGRSKGIETVINTLPEVCKKFPDLIYVVLGRLHPHVILHEGYTYIEELKQLAKDLGIENHVFFIEEYVGEEKLMAYLKATDIYITPYLNEAQITSGTLSYALSSGSAIVSTPYWHALELLKEKRGLLFNFQDSKALKDVLLKLLEDDELRITYQTNAFNYGQNITWPKIGGEYLEFFNQIIAQRKIRQVSIEKVLLHYLPEFSLEHFNRLTDQTGIFQHARFIFPDYEHGYTLDDNARALLMSALLNRNNPSEETRNLLVKFLSFINYMQLPDGRFLNFMDYSKKIHNGNVSEDAFGRTIWALGYTIHFSTDEMHFEFAKAIFLQASVQFSNLKSLRGIANTLIGITHYLKIFPHDSDIKKSLKYLSTRLEDAFSHHNKGKWVWFEEKLSYDNAILPMAMLCVSEFEGFKKYLLIAEKSIKFLEEIVFKDGRFSLVGNDPWMEKGNSKSDYSQQPIDALILVLFYGKAFAVTKNHDYLVKHRIAFSWFLGNNDVFIPVYDDQTKGCADGLFEDSVNRNQGAESLLAWLISFLAYKMVNLPC